MISAGIGIIWRKIRQRKTERRITGNRKEELRIGICELRIKFWMAHKMIMSRMPSSIKENAQSSIEPKAMGVKIKRNIRINLMALLSIAGLWGLSPMV
jgi:hypothetical protein